jgi:Flp pilus assembly protein TadG
MKRGQQGMATVEFAIVAGLALMTLFGVIEVGRVFFVLNALEEAARRGARVAAVCQVNDPAIQSIAAFADGGSTSNVISGLTTGNVAVQYLDASGNLLADPIGSFLLIGYVRVRITGLNHQLLIPLVTTSFTLPTVQTTLPAESLGVWPGGFSPC